MATGGPEYTRDDPSLLAVEGENNRMGSMVSDAQNWEDRFGLVTFLRMYGTK